jgi:hypothetical protein
LLKSNPASGRRASIHLDIRASASASLLAFSGSGWANREAFRLPIPDLVVAAVGESSPRGRTLRASASGEARRRGRSPPAEIESVEPVLED